MSTKKRLPGVPVLSPDEAYSYKNKGLREDVRPREIGNRRPNRRTPFDSSSIRNATRTVVMTLLLCGVPSASLFARHTHERHAGEQVIRGQSPQAADALRNEPSPSPSVAQTAESNRGSLPPGAFRNNPKIYTGISKPLPGERRFTPANAVKPKGPIPGTAVRPVIPSVWYPGVSRARISGPLDGALFPTLPAEETGGPIKAPELAEPAEKYEQQFPLDGAPSVSVPTGSSPTATNVPPKPGDTVLSFDLSEQTPSHLGLEERLSQAESGIDGFGHPEETIYMGAPMPRPLRFQPAFGDPDIPIGDILAPIGPPRALWYGKVENPLDENGEEIVEVLNAPFAPGQAAPKVFSNGREVTMSERARLYEGRAPIIRGTSVMAAHTHVASGLPQFHDGLEHCPVCCRAYLCGCGESECRFCNPDARIGPPPVCSYCGDARPCIHGEICEGQLGHAPYREYGNTSGGIACPICKEAVERVPCGCCEKCLRGETCELYKPCGKCPSCLIYERCDLYRAHRNCILRNRLNSCNRCDNTINGEPCGTCDWCRQNSGLNHEPCGHQEIGFYNTKTIYNPYNERPLFSAPPRWVTNRFNNRASKFPIYYNPAPHYKNTHNPSMLAAHQRPYTHRFTCDMCRHDPCTCTAPGNAGQVAYAYACKFCDRSPCACPGEICNVNQTINPALVRAQREELNKQNEPPRDWENAPDVVLEDDAEGDSLWEHINTFGTPPEIDDPDSEELPDFGGDADDEDEDLEHLFDEGPALDGRGTQRNLKPLPQVSERQVRRHFGPAVQRTGFLPN